MSDYLKAALGVVLQFLKREPAVLLGALASLLMVLSAAIVDAGATDWETAVPVVVSVVIRQFVTPTADPRT